MSFKLPRLLASTLLFSSTIAIAAGNTYKDMPFKDTPVCTTLPALHGGFYTGVQAGYESYDIDLNMIGVGGNSSTLDLNANGWAAGILGGYGLYYDNLLYIGGEAFWNYGSANKAINSNLASINGAPGTYYGKFNTYGTYGLALLPGIKLSDSTLTYVRLGYNWGKLKYQENATSIGSDRHTLTQGGFTYGIGMETVLINQWSVRGEYAYADYQSFTTNMNTTSATKIAPASNQFMVALLYHFN